MSGLHFIKFFLGSAGPRMASRLNKTHSQSYYQSIGPKVSDKCLGKLLKINYFQKNYDLWAQGEALKNF